MKILEFHKACLLAGDLDFSLESPDEVWKSPLPRTNIRAIKEPQDKVGLWRYLSFPKFLALLSQRSLYFSRTDCFADPYEQVVIRPEENHAMGYTGRLITKVTAQFKNPKVARRRLKAAGIDPEEFLQAVGTRSRNGLIKSERRRHSKDFERVFNSAFVCCWHNASHESDAMWKVYSDSHGVAVKTTVGRLRTSPLENTSIQVGCVEYVKKVTYSWTDHPHARFFIKRMPFKHEKEIRALIVDEKSGRRKQSGISLAVDLEKLIQAVVISPYSPPWYQNVVKETLRRFELDVPVHSSDIELPT